MAAGSIWKATLFVRITETLGQSLGPPPYSSGTCGDSPTNLSFHCSTPTTAGTTCEGNGASSSYSETIDSSGSVVARRIASSGCPNHYNWCTGKPYTPGCGVIGATGTKTLATDQNKSLVLPASPVLRTDFGIGVSGSDIQCTLQAIGIALNGVSIYGGAQDSDCNAIDVIVMYGEDWPYTAADWTAFDCCSGHAEADGDYHYHFPPSCLLAQIGDLSDGHSPQIGWAFDGFPIYGPKGPGGIDMRYGGDQSHIWMTTKCTEPYCLDVCGGLEMELPSVDKFKYRYYVAGATSDLSTLPTNPRPNIFAAGYFRTHRKSWTLNCYRGYTYNELASGSTGTSGVASSYVSAPMAGVTVEYSPVLRNGHSIWHLCGGTGITTRAQSTNGFCSDTPASNCYPLNTGVGAADGLPCKNCVPTVAPTIASATPVPTVCTHAQGHAIYTAGCTYPQPTVEPMPVSVAAPTPAPTPLPTLESIRAEAYADARPDAYACKGLQCFYTKCYQNVAQRWIKTQCLLPLSP